MSLNEITIGSNVKLSRPVAAILNFRSAQKITNLVEDHPVIIFIILEGAKDAFEVFFDNILLI
jgi:hypothetical protein